MTPQDRLTKARIGLLLDEPFFGSLLMQLKPVIDPTAKTFCTDGKVLRVNPTFLDTLNEPQLRTVLAHEVLHCALLHPYRRDQRDAREFNIAADYAINNFLDQVNQEASAKGHTPPFVFDGPLADACLDHQYDDLSAEEIYTRRQSNKPKGKDGDKDSTGGSGGNGGSPKPGGRPGKQPNPNGTSGSKPGQGGGGSPSASSASSCDDSPSSCGEFTDGAADEAGREEAEAEWKVAVKQAALGAKARGSLPGAMARLMDELTNPVVPWQEILRNFLSAFAKDDYSFARPNRRYSAAGGCILPGLHSPKLGKIIVAVDTSGSIGQKEFTDFMSEVQGILFNCQPETFILAQCDSRLTDWQELDAFADLKAITIKGGGGTDFRPVFARADQEAEPPVALIYLTDMYGTFPEVEPPYPVLWARTTGTDAPWGQIVDVEV